MINRKKVDYRELGLEIGLIFARYFLKTDHLHFGYWTDDIDVDINNLPQAQEKHSEFILSHIPEGVTTIFGIPGDP